MLLVLLLRLAPLPPTVLPREHSLELSSAACNRLGLSNAAIITPCYARGFELWNAIMSKGVRIFARLWSSESVLSFCFFVVACLACCLPVCLPSCLLTDLPTAWSCKRKLMVVPLSVLGLLPCLACFWLSSSGRRLPGAATEAELDGACR